MTLIQAQSKFTKMLGDLIQWVYQQEGYGLTLGEAYRTPAAAKEYARKGQGIAASLHCERLAIDLNLFIDGVYQTNSEAYLSLGEHWESLGGSWGGRFDRPDGNHFSLAYGGRR